MSIFALASLASPARAEETAVPGHVVVARVSDDALIIWDSSPEIAAIVTNKIADEAANNQLERDALKVLAQSLSKLEKTAKTVTVRVIYNKTGAVSPIYGAPTFAGVERYATLEVPYKFAASDRDKWKELDAKHAVPSWVTFKVIGQLPPR
jgi:hypothetical protein